MRAAPIVGIAIPKLDGRFSTVEARHIAMSGQSLPQSGTGAWLGQHGMSVGMPMSPEAWAVISRCRSAFMVPAIPGRATGASIRPTIASATSSRDMARPSFTISMIAAWGTSRKYRLGGVKTNERLAFLPKRPQERALIPPTTPSPNCRRARANRREETVTLQRIFLARSA